MATYDKKHKHKIDAFKIDYLLPFEERSSDRKRPSPKETSSSQAPVDLDVVLRFTNILARGGLKLGRLSD